MAINTQNLRTLPGESQCSCAAIADEIAACRCLSGTDKNGSFSFEAYGTHSNY